MKQRPWQVLVAEDEYDSKQLIMKILNHSGVDVLMVENGLECLAKLEETIPDLIVMDLAMPKLDGLQTLERLRANPDTAHIPVVAVTAYYSDELEADVSEAGFDAYFRKPIDPQTFVTSIAHLVKQ